MGGAGSSPAPPRRTDLSPTNPALLLVYLAVHGGWVSRERLAALFWPDSPDPDARHNLRLTLSRARRLEWAGALEAEPHRLRFAVPSDVQALRAAAAQQDWPGVAQLYQGAFLAGFPLDHAAGFREWAEQERAALARTGQDALTGLAARCEEAGDHTQAMTWHEALLDRLDTSEDAMQAYLRCAYLAGRADRALARFERFRQTVQAEHGLTPLPATLDLARLLRQSSPLPGQPHHLPVPPRPEVPLNVRRPPMLVGRTAALQWVAASDTAVTLVYGEPGIGKSRLLTEALPGARVLSCREGLHTLSYAPLIDDLRARRATLPPDAPHAEFARLLPELAPQGPSGADPELARVRLVEALAWALEADPTPLIVDDLHWADAATLQVLALVAARGRRRLYGTYRAGEEGPGLRQALDAWASGRLLSELRLRPLAEADVTELLTCLSGQATAPVLFGRWLRRASGGNPFFVLETLKSLFETGRLRAQNGSWHTDHDDQTADYSELDVPQAVADVVARRVARLSLRAQRVVQAASVVGEPLEARLLGRITGLSDWDTQAALDEAEEAGILQGHRFGHDLSRQSLYGSMSPGRRALLHAQTAQALERAEAAFGLSPLGHRAPPEPLVIAEHWLASNEPERAWPPMYRASLRALDRADYAGAQALLERVADHTSGTALHIEASIRLGASLLFSDLARGRGRLHTALAALQSVTPPDLAAPERLRLEAATYSALIDNAVYAGDQSQARVWLERLRPLMTSLPPTERSDALEAAIEVAIRDGDLPAFALTLQAARQALPHSETFEAYQAQLHWYRGEFAEAGAVFETLIARQPDATRRLTLENDLGMVCWTRGRLSEAARWLEASLTTWRDVQHTEALSRSNLGLVRASQGRWAAALALLDQAGHLARQIGSQTFLADVYHRRGLIHRWAGRIQEAEALYTEALALMERVGDPFRLSYIHAALVDASLHSGHETQAQVHLGAARSLARQVGHPVALALAGRSDTLAAQFSGDLTGARASAHALIALTRRHDMREHLGYALLAAAQLTPAQGTPNRRQQRRLEEAHRLGQEIGAPELLWRSGAALLKLVPDEHLQQQTDAAYRTLVEGAPAGWFSRGTA